VVRDSRLHPRCLHLANFSKQCTLKSAWRIQLSICVVFDFGLFNSLCENMMSSTKLKDINALHFHQRKTRPWPQVIMSRKFGEIWTYCFYKVWADIQKRQIDRQTRWSQYFAPHITAQTVLRTIIETYFDMRFGACMTWVSGVCWPCSDTQPSTMLRMDDIYHVPMLRSISATSSGKSILVHQVVS